MVRMRSLICNNFVNYSTEQPPSAEFLLHFQLSSSESEDEALIPTRANTKSNEMENCLDQSSQSENINECDKCYSNDCNYRDTICPIVQQTENGNSAIVDADKNDSVIDDIKQISGNKNAIDPVHGCQREIINMDLNLVEVIEPEANFNAIESVSMVNTSENSEHCLILDVAAPIEVSNIFKFVNETVLLTNGLSDGNSNFATTSVVSSKRPLIEEIESTEHVKNWHDFIGKQNNDESSEHIYVQNLRNECHSGIQLGHQENRTDLNELKSRAIEETEWQYSEESESKALESVDVPPESKQSNQQTKIYRDCITYYCTDLKNLCENQSEYESDSLSIETVENSEESRVNTPTEHDI